MANKDSMYGARSVGGLLGADYNGKVHSYTVLATDAVALFVGDFVKLTGESDNGEEGKNHAVVAQAAATEVLVGFVDSFHVNSSYLNQIYRTASTLRTVRIYDDPYVIFEIQAKGTLATTDLQLVADINVSAGSTVTGLSGMEVDLSSKTTASGQLRILAISPREDNDFGADADVICMINEHQYKSTAGV